MKALRGLWVLLGLLGTGCVVDVTTTRNVYESCAVSEGCAGSSACLVVPYNNGVAGRLCTITCSPGTACFGNGFCVADPGQIAGHCYRPCTTDIDCGYATVCRSVGSTLSAQVCVPNTPR